MVTWRVYGLDLKDYEIFLSLKNNPLQSNAEIGRTVNLSSEAVRSRIHAMKSKGFLRDNRTIKDPVLGERLQSESNGVYQPRALGLLRQHIILKGIPDRRALEALNMLCDEHPYTHYYAPAYGESSALYIQFDIPPQISQSMKKLLEGLRKDDYFSKYVIVDEMHSSICSADFSKWDEKRDAWQIGQKEKSWLKKNYSDFEHIWKKHSEVNDGFTAPRIIPERSYDFDNLDARLLRELTINSKPVLTHISTEYAKDSKLEDEFKKDSTTLSRRISKLREHIVTRDLLFYDRRVFDLTYPQLVTGRFRKGSDLSADTLYKFISSGALPFETMAFSNTDEFLLYSMTPPSIAPELSELIWDHAQDTSVLQLQLDASRTYFFYQENYVNGEWRTDEDYVLHDPLARIQRS
ncbi:MAG: winged helix-turn-helix transcriptional regulator [Candidatus Thorarchaeota archaeon]